MSRRALFPLLAGSLALVLTLPLHAQAPGPAQETRLRVRVVSHDAKIIGSGVGGARVTVRDVATGRVLATGMQEGGTGSTPAIIQTPRERGATVFDTEGAAVFNATVELGAPTQVEVVAEGPLGAEQAMQRASKTLLLVPGRHIEGDGLVLELHGFTVEIQSPEEATPAGTPIEVSARVTMLCGCPTEPGGLWDADRMEITARLVRDGTVIAEAPMTFSGETSVYTGSIARPDPGTYELEVLAVDKVAPNAGLASKTIRVAP